MDSQGLEVIFTPVYGTDHAPLCYLLEVNNIVILLDCGWSIGFDPKVIEPLRSVAPRVDLVLLSHPGLAHLGALPYAVANFGLQAPVYSTLPVFRMGMMFLVDAHQSRELCEDFTTFTLDDVEEAFSDARCKQLKYSQPLHLSGKGDGITVTPHQAGHMIGSCVWKISKEGNDVVYAVDFNHAKERHLAASAINKLFRRPAVLITDARSAMSKADKQDKREQDLIDHVLGVAPQHQQHQQHQQQGWGLRGGGNVLIPVDTAGRVLELLLVLDQAWKRGRFESAYPLVLLENVGFSTLEFAKTMMEYMDPDITAQFNLDRVNPFDLQRVKVAQSLDELATISPGTPKLVLATPTSMGCGFSNQLLADWAADPRNLVLITSRAAPGTVAHALLSTEQGGLLQFRQFVREPLVGKELEAYLEEKRAEREVEALARRSRADETAMKAMAEGRGGGGGGGGRGGVLDWGFGKYATPRYPLFAINERRFVYDDYGQRIRPGDFIEAALRASGSGEAEGALADGEGGGRGGGEGFEGEAGGRPRRLTRRMRRRRRTGVRGAAGTATTNSPATRTRQ